MVIATLLALWMLFGGGGLEFYLTNLKGPVKEYVQDEARQDAIIEISKALAEDLQAEQKTVEGIFEQIMDVQSRHASTGADFDQVTVSLVDHQKQSDARVLDARDEMHAQMTAAEWTAVFQESEK